MDEETLYDGMLQRLARLLGREAEDPLLALALDGAVDAVKNYCGLAEIPKGLAGTVVDMARDDFRSANYGGGSAARTVASVKRGDVQTTFSTSAVEVAAVAGGESSRGARPGYLQILNQYRRTGW